MYESPHSDKIHIDTRCSWLEPFITVTVYPTKRFLIETPHRDIMHMVPEHLEITWRGRQRGKYASLKIVSVFWTIRTFRVGRSTCQNIRFCCGMFHFPIYAGFEWKSFSNEFHVRFYGFYTACLTFVEFRELEALPFSRDWFGLIEQLTYINPYVNMDSPISKVLCTQLKCYFSILNLGSRLKSWFYANQQCQKNEGALVTINSYEEYLLLLHLLRMNEKAVPTYYQYRREFVFAGMHFSGVSITVHHIVGVCQAGW